MAAPWRRGIEFLAFDSISRGYGKSIEFEKIPEGQRPEESTFCLSYENAQTLMDDLWTCGLRPTEGTGSAGSLKATQDHLEDMRKIAFRFLEK